MTSLSEEKRLLLARRLRERGLASVSETARAPIPRRGRARPARLSFAQQRLWLLDRLEPGNPFYNVGIAVELEGTVSPGVLARCFAAIVRRHESLRTVFLDEEGSPIQTTAAAPEDAAWPLPLADLSGLPEAVRPSEAGRLAWDEARRPFDLERGPLLRTSLLRLAPDCHLLLITQHHIVSDGWSNLIFLREMAALYEAFAEGLPSPLPELPVQYADFSEWQRDELRGERLAAELAFWRGALEGAPEALELPLDRPRPPVQTYRGAHRPLRVEPGLAAGIRRLAKEAGATPFMVLLAAFGVLLRRITGQDDLLIGTPIAGRRRREVEGLIGFFVNTLVLRVDAAGDPRFRDLLDRARETAHAAYEHQDLPFEHLIEELQPDRDPSRPVLVQAMFSLDEAPEPVFDLPGLRLRLADLPSGTAKLDLTLSLVERDCGFSGAVEFNTDLFETATAARLGEQYRTLLAAAAAHPETALGSLPLLTIAESHQLSREWNDTASEETPGGTLLDRIAERVRQVPAALAIDGSGGTLTYRELDRRARALASRLRELGVGPETRIGVCLERSPEALVSFLGVLLSGGAFVPLDPEEPSERLAFLLEDSGVAAVISSRSIAARLPVKKEITVLSPSPPNAGTGLVPAQAERPPHPEQAAYVLYTSGSTGRPKGAVVSHRSLLTYSLAAIRLFRLTERDRFLQFAPLSFDVCLEEIFPTWASGGAVVLEEPDRLVSVAELGGRMAVWNVTVAELPTAFWREWEGHLLAAGERPPVSLRLLIVGGEKAPAEAVARWHAWDLGLVNAYGLTETTITTTVFSGIPGPRPELSIGRPVQDAQVYVLDALGALAALGVAGQLAIGGGAVGRGYLGRPDLTAERFAPDPWSESPGGRLYLTGDLARFLPDGNLEFLGRMDHQVKIRGFRVETGEVEAALAAHPAVRQAAVVARDVPGTGRQLVAYIATEQPAESAALREWLRERLPDFMVPAFLVALPQLPLTSRGKIDRRALPVPAGEIVEAGPVPRSPVEETLASIWSEALGLERGERALGLHDDFFERGGHSLLATRVISRIRTAFEIELPLRSLFEAPTVAGLAARVESEVRRGQGLEAPPILPRGEATTGAPSEPGEQRRAPLSFAQGRLWFLDRLEPGSAAYNLPLAVRLEGALDPAVLAAMAAALAAVVRRHESLRTTFSLAEGGVDPVQVIARETDGLFPLPVADLAGLPTERREEEARRLAGAEARRPFDLSRGPLLRALLVELAPAEALLSLTLHHIVGDGWSLEILIREIGAFYGSPSVDPEPLPIQYADFAVWQREWLQGGALETQLRFWKGEMAGVAPHLELPADRSSEPGEPGGSPGSQHRWDVPADLVEPLRALSRKRGATLFMTLLAGFEALLHRYGGQDRFLVGSPIANRNRAETEGLIGFFVNTLALRADLTEGPEPGGLRFQRLLDRVRSSSLAAYAHQDLPFERLVEELRAGGGGGEPLFQAVFALENAPAEPPHPAGLVLKPLPVDSGTAKWDLLLSIVDAGARLAAAWEYRTRRFDPATIDRMSVHLGNLLAGAAADPDAPIASLPLLSQGEQEQLRAWSRNDVPYPRNATIHGLFAEQAARTPGAVALVWGAEEISYRELAERSSGLARRLVAAGVGPERIVAFLLDRSPAAVTALLAIVQAGGAYLPLDPSHPPERLRWMLADAGAVLLLTDDSAGYRHPWIVEAGIPTLTVGDFEGDGLDAVDEHRLTADHLAYVLYTSGSTGTPKGVAVTHRNVVRLVKGADYADLGPDQTFLQFAPLAFDASTLEVWGPLLNGGRLVLFPEARASLDDLAEAIPLYGVTSLWLTAGLFHQMVEHRLEALRPLRQLLAGGDALSPVHVRRALEGLPETVLINGYGPTEGTTFTCCYKLPGLEAGRETVPVGRPIANSKAHVLDASLEPVPQGAAGELYAGGDGLARGYLGQPDRTAERFVPDPFGAAGERLYRTGDRARWRSEGVLEVLGRLDRQVKIRGFRVEPGEVEAALATHPEVRDAAVVALPEPDGGHLLAAFVVPREEGPPEKLADLQDWLRARLPEPLIPAAWTLLEALPLTPNGKVDRRALAEAGAGRRRSRSMPFTPPGTPLEEQIVAVSAELLGLDPGRVSVHDNFFDLGGHSLLATQLAVHLRDRWGIEVPLKEIFETEDLAALADRIMDLELAKAEEGDLGDALAELERV